MDTPESCLVSLPVEVADALEESGFATPSDATNRGAGDAFIIAVAVVGVPADVVTLYAAREHVREIASAIVRWARGCGPSSEIRYLDARGPGGRMRFELTEAPDPDALETFLRDVFDTPEDGSAPLSSAPESSSD